MKNLSRNWTREEVLEALALYCQLPFGQLHSRNPAIIDLAQSLNRTPSSIAMKLVNLASLDPTLKARGISGMSNSSKLDQEVWKDNFGKWESIASTLPDAIADKLEKVATGQSQRERNAPEGPTQVMRPQLVRRGQQFFRVAVLAAYQNKCCISGIEEKSLLRASHIIPWSKSEEHRLNPMNGLCFNSLHDASFDQGLISIDKDRKLILSRKLKASMPPSTFDQMFGQYQGKQIAIPEKFSPSNNFIEYHRSNIFQP